MPSRFALQHLFSFIFTLTKAASLLTISGATPNKSVEPTRVIAVRVIRASQVAGGSPLIVRRHGFEVFDSLSD